MPTKRLRPPAHTTQANTAQAEREGEPWYVDKLLKGYSDKLEDRLCDIPLSLPPGWRGPAYAWDLAFHLVRGLNAMPLLHRKLDRNPMQGIKLFRENNARVRYLTEQEEFCLFQQLPPRYHPIVRIGLLTGLRASNLLGLRWRDVDLEAKVYTVPLSKSGDALRLPMHPRVQEILTALPRNGAYIFAEADGQSPWDFTHAFARAARTAGIQDLHLHDLRHTWASRMAMAGVDLLTIKELGGWKTIQMVQRYAHLSPDHKRQAIERLQVAATYTELLTAHEGQLSATIT